MVSCSQAVVSWVDSDELCGVVRCGDGKIHYNQKGCKKKSAKSKASTKISANKERKTYAPSEVVRGGGEAGGAETAVEAEAEEVEVERVEGLSERKACSCAATL